MKPFMFSSENTPSLYKSCQPTRHIVVVPKSSYRLLSEEHLINKIQQNTAGEIREIYQHSSSSRMIVISYFSLQGAKECHNFIEKHFKLEYYTYYAKPCCIHKNMNEKVFVTMKNTFNQHLSIEDFNYMDYLARIGAIYTISESIISPSCIIVNLEYDDERSTKILFNQYDESLLEGVKFNVYATINDRFTCTCHETFIANHIIYPKEDSLLSVLQKTSGHSYFSTNPFTQAPLTVHDNEPLTSSSSSPLLHTSTNIPTQPTIANKKNQTQSSSSSPTSSSKQSQADKEKNIQTSVELRTINDIDVNKIGSGQDKRTTFMIRNIPNKYTQQMLIDCINTTHENSYDFIYLPIDFQNKCNVGYAFINFMEPKTVLSFIKERVGKKWTHFNSDKKFSLSYANIQGKKALIKKFKNSSLMTEDAAYRPKIFYSSGQNKGREQEFPKPDFSFDDRSSTSLISPRNNHRHQSYKP